MINETFHAESVRQYSSAPMTATHLKKYAFRVAEDGQLLGPDPDDAGQKLVDEARRYAAEHRIGFKDALSTVLAHPDNVDLVDEYYNAINSAPPPARPDVAADGARGAGARLHSLALAKMASKTCSNYSAAVAVVLRENPHLAAQWNSSGSAG